MAVVPMDVSTIQPSVMLRARRSRPSDEREIRASASSLKALEPVDPERKKLLHSVARVLYHCFIALEQLYLRVLQCLE